MASEMLSMGTLPEAGKFPNRASFTAAVGIERIMTIPIQKMAKRSPRHSGFTLIEVVISMGLAALTLAAIITGYTSTAERAEWSAYSLAANEMALQRLEQTRATKWDLQVKPTVDELMATNFPPQVRILDVPITGDTNNATRATNYTTIRQISANPPLKFIQVDCVWQFLPGEIYTNTVSTYRAPDA